MSNSNIHNTSPRVDLNSLLRDTEDSWRIWHIRDIYLGPTSTGRRVPNVGDHVIDDANGVRRVYRVVTIDELTKIAELSRLEEDKQNVNDTNRMKGVGPGHRSEIWRCYHDTSLIPHTLRPDDNLYFHGSDIAYYKIFLGTDINTRTGRVISQYRDRNTGNVTDNVPVEKAYRNHDPISIPVTCHTTSTLKDGEVVTVVTYSDSGTQLSADTLLIVNTAEVKRTEAPRRFVADIELVSSHISATADKLIEFPVNMAKEQLHFMCRITYTDGSVIERSIDGDRVKLHGLTAWLNTEGTLVLTYTLADDEDAIGDVRTVGTKRHMFVNYTARTIEVQGAYSVRLHVVPVYEYEEWTLKYFIYNLDRDIYYEVTSLVQTGANATPFNPTRFGQMQRVVTSINLQDVDPSLMRYQHAQVFEITLMGTPNNTVTPFYIGYEAGQEPAYGKDIVALYNRNTVNNLHEVVLSSGAQNLDEWLDRLYYRTKPLYNHEAEVRPPKPTHFVLKLESGDVKIPVERWSETFTIPTALKVFGTLRIEWIVEDKSTTRYLSCSPLIIRHA